MPLAGDSCTALEVALRSKPQAGKTWQAGHRACILTRVSMQSSSDSSGSASNGARPHKRRWPWVVGAIALALAIFIAVFDWNWFRGPLERRLSESSGRPVTIGRLDVELARFPRIVLSDIAIGNADWAGDKPLGILRELMFSVSIPSLFTNHVVLPYV